MQVIDSERRTCWTEWAGCQVDYSFSVNKQHNIDFGWGEREWKRELIPLPSRKTRKPMIGSEALSLATVLCAQWHTRRNGLLKWLGWGSQGIVLRERDGTDFVGMGGGCWQKRSSALLLFGTSLTALRSWCYSAVNLKFSWTWLDIRVRFVWPNSIFCGVFFFCDKGSFHVLNSVNVSAPQCVMMNFEQFIHERILFLQFEEEKKKRLIITTLTKNDMLLFPYYIKTLYVSQHPPHKTASRRIRVPLLGSNPPRLGYTTCATT